MLFTTYLWRNPRMRKRVFGTFRVLAYGLVVSAGLGALTIRSAVANVEEKSLDLGRQLDGLQDLLQTGYELRLNGQKVFIATTETEESVKTVMDRFEGHCNKSTAFDPIEWQALGNMKNDSTAAPPISRMGVVRKEDPKVGDGVVLCFTSDHGAKDFFVALRNFGQSGDLHDLGDVRYVHVAPRVFEDKKHHTTKLRTVVQTLWTEGSFNVNALIGDPNNPNKDTVGSDFANLPRPLSSVRRFTAEAMGTPYAARIYESTATEAQVMDDYNKKMLDNDWIAVRNPTVDMPAGKDGRWYTKPETGENALIAVNPGSAGKTMVAVGSVGVLEKGTPKVEVVQ